MTSFVYLRTEPRLWTVGHYDQDGRFQPESDHGTEAEAADRVILLNGGAPDSDELDDLRAELERQRPVIEAARAWRRSGETAAGHRRAEAALIAAIDAYEADRSHA